MTSAPNRASMTIRVSHLRGTYESTSLFAIRSPIGLASRGKGRLVRRSAAPDPRIGTSSSRLGPRRTVPRSPVYRDIPCLGRAAPAGDLGPRSGTNLTCRPHGTGSSLSALLRGFTVRVTLLRTSLSRATAHDGLAIGVTSLYQ